MQIDLSLYDATLVPSIIFLLYIIGNLGIPRKLLPVMAVILSIAAALIFIEFSANGVLTGILLAATVVGIHSGTKNVIQAFSDTVTGHSTRQKQVTGNYLDEDY